MRLEKKNSEQEGDKMKTWSYTRRGELQHHGIKGQKWGVRRFQNKDGSLTPAGRRRYKTEERSDGTYVIKKGSEVHRVSQNPHSEKKGYAYISFMQPDVDGYRKEMTGVIKNETNFKGKSFDMTMKVTKDLILPSERTKVETFIKLFENDKIDAADMCVMKLGATNNKGELYGRPKKVKDGLMKQGMDENTAEYYALFSMCLYRSDNYRQTFFNELKKQGYNAIEDIEDSYSHRMKPVIVFERENNLKVVNVEEIPGILDDSEAWKKTVEKAKKAKEETEEYHKRRGLK